MDRYKSQITHLLSQKSQLQKDLSTVQESESSIKNTLSALESTCRIHESKIILLQEELEIKSKQLSDHSTNITSQDVFIGSCMQVDMKVKLRQLEKQNEQLQLQIKNDASEMNHLNEQIKNNLINYENESTQKEAEWKSKSEAINAHQNQLVEERCRSILERTKRLEELDTKNRSTINALQSENKMLRNDIQALEMIKAPESAEVDSEEGRDVSTVGKLKKIILKKDEQIKIMKETIDQYKHIMKGVEESEEAACEESKIIMSAFYNIATKVAEGAAERSINASKKSVMDVPTTRKKNVVHSTKKYGYYDAKEKSLIRSHEYKPYL
ncbi:hypothetical protein AKO1_012085 [Acrasis kona]|uniref:Uncharacterized protein n=1 Tax=Acrasis kona TaxID=1008807 RepID=A0AAW2ZBR1_9EUKA